MQTSLGRKAYLSREKNLSTNEATTTTVSTCRSVTDSIFKETEYIRSYKLRIAALERELAEKSKALEKLGNNGGAVVSASVPAPKAPPLRLQLENAGEESRQKPEETSKNRSQSAEHSVIRLKPVIFSTEKEASSRPCDNNNTGTSIKTATTTTAIPPVKLATDPRNIVAELRRKDAKIERLEKMLENKEAELQQAASLLRERKDGASREEMESKILELEALFSRTQNECKAKAEEEAIHYKKQCKEMEAELSSAKTALQNVACTNGEELDRYKQKLNEQSDLRIRDLLSQNGFLKVQVDQLQQELKHFSPEPYKTIKESRNHPLRQDAALAAVEGGGGLRSARTVTLFPAKAPPALKGKMPKDLAVELGNLQRKLKFVAEERDLARQELENLRKELARAKSAAADKEGLEEFCTELNTRLEENKTVYEFRISELEAHIRSLTAVLEKWTLFGRAQKNKGQEAE